MDGMTRRESLKMAGLTIPLAAAALGAQRPHRKPYLILSCDGGGIRGLLSARIIQRLQAEIPFLDQVDLFAGTSTGGLIALGLANGASPDDLVDLYRGRGAEIFTTVVPRPPVKGRLRGLFVDLGDRTQHLLGDHPFAPRELFHPKYPIDGLRAVLTDFFGDATLGGLRTGKSALVTTLRLFTEAKNWAPLVLHNVGEGPGAAGNNRVQDCRTPATKLLDAALCTSAAPLYFPPHLHPEFGFCVDGGLFANCPASVAMGLACRANKGGVRGIRILSIGTGTQVNGIDIDHSLPFNRASEYGALAWLSPVQRGERVGGKETLTPSFPLISALMDSGSAAHDYICEQALGGNYHRVQVRLPRPIPLDDTSREALDFLASADGLIPAVEWKATTDWLRAQLA